MGGRELSFSLLRVLGPGTIVHVAGCAQGERCLRHTCAGDRMAPAASLRTDRVPRMVAVAVAQQKNTLQTTRACAQLSFSTLPCFLPPSPFFLFGMSGCFSPFFFILLSAHPSSRAVLVMPSGDKKIDTRNGDGHDDNRCDYCDDDYVPPAQRGVLFFSTIPRDMRPQEVRTHFNEFGKILRQKFTPFPKKERRPGGPLLPLQFMNGYLEFAHAEDARRAAAAMNGTPVACKRRRKCHGQLWTVRFLDDFTWDTLLEQKEETRRTRRQREAEARSAERAINEAYRAAVLGAMRRKHTRGEGGASPKEPSEYRSPKKTGRREQNVTGRMLRDVSVSSDSVGAAAVTPLEVVKKKRRRESRF
ncbi:hypothetical protein TCDM_08439 [Trypanosoma cruzi Dm28c]|uniref:RRM domain-containing protein n=1 Tax=Trypanosoma cruzi Dm28c TaxID=1416333 RepID=V5D893_TRYCR|nr:hypothetical protein TCDM_08439 [Trypanosoma cruzi Dm28c]